MQTSFVLTLDLSKALNESWVRRLARQGSEVVKGGDPLVDITDGLGDQVGEGSVAAVNPAARSDTVSFVLKLARVKFMELLEQSFLE